MSYSPEFLAVKALKHLNASFTDIKEWYYEGSYEDEFMRFAMLFYLADTAFTSHTEDAVELEREARMKVARAKAEAQGKK